MSEDSQRINGL